MSREVIPGPVPALGPSEATTTPTPDKIPRANGSGNIAQGWLADLITVVSGLGSASRTITVSVNAKGLITAISAQDIAITESQVTGLVTDLSNKVPTSRLVSAGTGLAGGGDLGADRTISLGTAGTAGTYGDASHTIVFTTDAYGRVTSVTATVIAIAESQVTGLVSDLSTLTSAVAAKVPTTRTVTAGAGLTGGGALSADITLALASILTGATVGSASKTVTITFDVYGRATSIAQQDILITESQVTNLTTDLAAKVATSRQVIAGTGLSGGGALSADVTLSLPNVGTAVTKGSASKTVAATTDAQGRVSSLADQDIAIAESQVTNLVTDLATITRHTPWSLAETPASAGTYDDEFETVTVTRKDYEPYWVASTAYPIGARVSNGGNLYRCITAGTSAGGGGPTTTSSNITDNTVHWAYIVADALPAWSNGAVYAVGDWVSNSGKIYQCATAGTASVAPTGILQGIAGGGTVTWNYNPIPCGTLNGWNASIFITDGTRTQSMNALPLTQPIDNAVTAMDPFGFRAWTISTAYVVGDTVSNGTTCYICTTGGTSAGATGPTGSGQGISDNTAVWSWVGWSWDATSRRSRLRIQVGPSSSSNHTSVSLFRPVALSTNGVLWSRVTYTQRFGASNSAISSEGLIQLTVLNAPTGASAFLNADLNLSTSTSTFTVPTLAASSGTSTGYSLNATVGQANPIEYVGLIWRGTTWWMIYATAGGQWGYLGPQTVSGTMTYLFLSGGPSSPAAPGAVIIDYDFVRSLATATLP